MISVFKPQFAVWLCALAFPGTLQLCAASPLDDFLPEFWLADGPVNAMMASGDTVYIGGGFNYIGPHTWSGAVLDVTSGERDPAWPLVGSTSDIYGGVLVVIPDGADGWFLGGQFETVEGVYQPGLVHLLADKSVDEGFTPNLGGFQPYVNCLALSGGRLFVGGSFSSVGGLTRHRLAAVNPINGNVLDWNPRPVQDFPNSRVSAIVVSGNFAYVGGIFNEMGGVARTNLAAVNVTTGLATSWSPNPDNNVYAMVLSGTSLCVGGYFTRIAGTDRHYLAAFDTTTGDLLPWTDDNADGQVNALAVSGSTILAGGRFSRIGGSSDRSRIAAIDPATGSATSWNPSVRSLRANAGIGEVFAIAVSGGTVFVGGLFSEAGGEQRKNLAALNASTGGALENWNPGTDGTVNTMASAGSSIYVGGYFNSIGGASRNNLAALDAATGAAPPWNPDTDYGAEVKTLALDGATVYATGSFTNAGGQSRGGIVALDALSGSVTPWNPNPGPGSAPDIRAAALDANTFYVGGLFTAIGGQPRRNLAAIDRSTGAITGWNPDPGAGSTVLALGVKDDRIYVGGIFASIGGRTLRNLAAISAATGQAFPWNPDPSAPVAALALAEEVVYAGGQFMSIGGTNRPFLAAVDRLAGSTTDWNPIGSVSPNIRALSLANGWLYVAGSRLGGGSGVNFKQVDPVTGATGSWAPRGRNDISYAVVEEGRAVALTPNRIVTGGVVPGYLVGYTRGFGLNPVPDLTAGMVFNGGFESGLAGWITSGGVQWTNVEGFAMANLTTDTNASECVTMTQSIDTPMGSFMVEFDYKWLTTNGTFSVLIEGTEVAVFAAPSPTPVFFSHASILINDTNLMGRFGAALEFRLCPGSLADLLLAGIFSPFFVIEDLDVDASARAMIFDTDGMINGSAVDTDSGDFQESVSVDLFSLLGTGFHGEASSMAGVVPPVFGGGVEYEGFAEAETDIVADASEQESDASSRAKLESDYEASSLNPSPIALNDELLLHATASFEGSFSALSLSNQAYAELEIQAKVTTYRASSLAVLCRIRLLADGTALYPDPTQDESGDNMWPDLVSNCWPSIPVPPLLTTEIIPDATGGTNAILHTIQFAQCAREILHVPPGERFYRELNVRLRANGQREFDGSVQISVPSSTLRSTVSSDTPGAGIEMILPHYLTAVRLDADTVRVSWFTNDASGWALEFTDDLSPPATWQSWGVASLSGRKFVADDPVGGVQRFYRLHKP